MLLIVQSEKSQAHKTLVKQSQYGLTCLPRAALPFLISDTVNFGTQSSDSLNYSELQTVQAVTLCYR